LTTTPTYWIASSGVDYLRTLCQECIERAVICLACGAISCGHNIEPCSDCIEDFKEYNKLYYMTYGIDKEEL